MYLVYLDRGQTGVPCGDRHFFFFPFSVEVQHNATPTPAAVDCQTPPKWHRNALMMAILHQQPNPPQSRSARASASDRRTSQMAHIDERVSRPASLARHIQD